MAEQTRDVYMNRIQQRIFYAGARDVRLLAARRFGKTDGGIGPRIWATAESMPQGAGAFLGSSRKQIYARTIPGVIAAVERFYGLKEGTHFGWGRPPKGVPKCIIRPKSYDNCIWFANGVIVYCASLSTVGSVNGQTLNFIIADECKFLPKKKIDEEVMPALSGIVHPYGDKRFTEENPFYKSTFFCSDASLTSRGDWLSKEEKMMDTIIDHGELEGRTYREVQAELDRYADTVMRYNELLRTAKKEGRQIIVVSKETRQRIEALAGAVMAREGQFKVLAPNWASPIGETTIKTLLSYHLIKEEDADLLFNHRFLLTQEEHYELMAIRSSKKYHRHINTLRCNAFYFVRASSLDNIDILGEDYIRRMKRDLPPITFMVSVLNIKLGRVGEGFYYAFDPDVHCYLPDDCPAVEDSIKVKQATTVTGGTAYGSEYETPDFQLLGEKNDSTLDGDCLDDEDLHIAFDAGKIVNWIVTGQIYKRGGREVLNVISSMFAKDGRMVQHLIKDWSEYYAPHRRKNQTVHFYYDHTFKFKPTGVYIDDIKDTIIKELTRYGWKVNPIPIGQTWSHHARYRDIGEGMSGLGYMGVAFNKENNEALCAAIENCGVKVAYSGATSTMKKDKAGEKLATDAERATAGAEPEELRTDGTDAFDTLYIGVRHYRNGMSLLMMPNGH